MKLIKEKPSTIIDGFKLVNGDFKYEWAYR